MSRVQAPQWVMSTFALAAAIALVLAIPLAADGGERPSEITPDGPSIDVGDRETTPRFADELWFVEFSGEPTARGGSVAAMAQERNALRRDARAAGVEFEERFDFRSLWNGISIRASASEAHALAEMASAAAVYPVELIDAPDPQQTDPQLATALGMTGADHVASELGFDGEGFSVAIVDTGIDYNHPDLGGDGDQDKTYTAKSSDDRELSHEGTLHPRITHGWDYVGDEYDASDPELDVPEPNDDPMDPNGHGTHVAGIVGANAADEDGVTGVAPGVTFGAYKVFGAGSSSADVIIAAMEDAHEDGMDIINMSLGAAFAWGDYPTSTAANELVDQGTVLVVSAGNNGTAGVFSLGAPGNASDVIGVASADNLFMNASVMEIDGLDGPDGDDLPYTGISAAELPPTEGESDPIVWIGRACTSLGDALEGDPSGATALIVRGNCTFEEKYDNAVAAGATGVIIHNNLPGLFAGGGIVPEEGVWAAATTLAHGEALHDYVEAEEDVTATFTDREIQVANPSGGMISSFSSYGMTPDLQFRPDITAPGGLIQSTYPLAAGGYATISGTSMSAPHVAGGVALLLDARPDLEAHEVRGVLQNSAEPMVWALNPGLGFLEPAYRQGAGMMRIDRSITSTTSVSPNRVELGDAPTAQTQLQIQNSGDEQVTYQLGHTGTIGTAGFGSDPWGDWATIFFPQFAGPTSTAQYSEADTRLFRVRDGECTNARASSSASAVCVRVAPGGSASVNVTITNPDVGLYAHQASGYLTVASPDDTKVVPYAGLAGDLWDIEIWPDERPQAIGLDNQLVTQFVDGSLTIVPDGHRFNLARGDEPVAAVFMGFAAQQVEVLAVHESGLETTIAEVEFARRSASEAEYLTYTWDGRLADGSRAPNGEYVFEVRALKVGGDPAGDAGWEVGETTSFILRSPGGGPR